MTKLRFSIQFLAAVELIRNLLTQKKYAAYFFFLLLDA